MIFRFIKNSYQNVQKALVKTGSLIGQKMASLFKGRLDEDVLEQFEKIFYEADLGVQTTNELLGKIKAAYQQNPAITSQELVEVVRQEILSILTKNSSEITPVNEGEEPLVILIVGVNGNGKTTSVAKLAKRFLENDKKVLIAAADTFRAAATEQLDIWAQRLQVDIIKGNPKTDPSAIVFDSIAAAKARKADVVLIDTAGRLHTKMDLMQELEKIRRVCNKSHAKSPHETFLVLDATSGQNAIDQAKTFHRYTPLTGLILTKLDGQAKGGVVVSIQRQIGVPVKFIGVGEGVDDLQHFEPEEFTKVLFSC